MRQGSLCGMLRDVSSRGHMPREGEGVVVRRGQLIALVGIFLIGCAVLLMAGASVVQAETSKKKEEGRCQGTRTIKHGLYITNDIPGCPKGGLLLGTDKSDGLPADRPGLDGKDGDDTIRGLGGSDEIFHGSGDDVVYGGDGDDEVFPDSGHDVIYGGDGNDKLYSNDVDGGDKLYCGAGRDTYYAEKNDYVDSSCEKEPLIAQAANPLQACARIDKKLEENRPLSREESRLHAPPGFCSQFNYTGHDDLSLTSSASASPTPVPLGGTGGPAILLPAAALLLGSGILTYAILRRR